MAWDDVTPPPPNPWVSPTPPAPAWTEVTACSDSGPPVTVNEQQKTQTLYYKAYVGQGLFPLANADMLGNNVMLTTSFALGVTKNGLRLMPDDGSGTLGDFTVDVPHNQVNLVVPCNLNDELFIDLYSVNPPSGTGPQGPAGPGGSGSVSADAGNYVRLGSDNRVYAPQAVQLTGGPNGIMTGGLTVPGLIVNGTAPTIAWKATGSQGVDQKNWDIYNAPDASFSVRALNDAYSAASFPLQFVRGTGYQNVSITVNAPTSFAGSNGISFGSTLGATTLDCSKHIALWGTVYGINVTSGRMNVVGGSLAYVNTTGDDAWTVNSAGGASLSNYQDSNGLVSFVVRKSRGGAMATPTAVLQNDFAGQIAFQAHNGTNFSGIATIRNQVTEPTPSPTAMGCQIDMLLNPYGTNVQRQSFIFRYGETQILTSSANASGAILSLQKSGSGQGATINSYTGTTATTGLRWQIVLGNNTAESGSNVGSDFELRTYSDTGVQISVPILVNRASSAVAIRGTSTNDNAAAGQVGEVISSNVTTGVTLTSGVSANVTSISLTPGDWDVSGEVWFQFGTGAATAVRAAINTVTAALPAASAINTATSSVIATLNVSAGMTLSLRPSRASLSATTTYFLVALCTFPSGTTTATGNIIARRMR